MRRSIMLWSHRSPGPCKRRCPWRRRLFPSSLRSHSGCVEKCGRPFLVSKALNQQLKVEPLLSEARLGSGAFRAINAEAPGATAAWAGTAYCGALWQRHSNILCLPLPVAFQYKYQVSVSLLLLGHIQAFWGLLNLGMCWEFGGVSEVRDLAKCSFRWDQHYGAPPIKTPERACVMQSADGKHRQSTQQPLLLDMRCHTY